MLVTIQPDGVRRPVAVAALSLVLALSQNLVIKHRITQAGRWHDRLQHMGTGLVGRSLGVVGAGSIGKELLALARPFGLRLLAADPYADPAALQALDTDLVSLDELLSQQRLRGHPGAALAAHASHDRCVATVAHEARRHADQHRPRPGGGRGRPDHRPAEAARIAGAALDVFEQEPVDPGNPLLRMDNVIVTPHALCWTDQCFAGIAESGFRSILEVAAGRVPGNAVNPAQRTT